MDQKPSLSSLGVKVLSQNVLEKKVAYEADSTILAKEIEVETKRLNRAETILKRHETKFHLLKAKLDNGIRYGTLKISDKQDLKRQLDNLTNGELKLAQNDVNDIKERLENAKRDQLATQDTNLRANDDNEVDEKQSGQLPSESNEEYLIRTGKITAFGNTTGFRQSTTNRNNEVPTHTNLVQPGILQNVNKQAQQNKNNSLIINVSKDRPSITESVKREEEDYDAICENEDANDSFDDKLDDYVPDDDDLFSDEKIEEPIDVNENDDFGLGFDNDTNTNKELSKVKTMASSMEIVDDGDELYYQHRLKEWCRERSELRRLEKPDFKDDPEVPEWQKPHPTEPDAVLNESFKIPGDIFPSLFDYQKTCVQWLYELHSQKTGGIIGDEMGLGKTVQMIAFLAGLHYSNLLKGPVLVVCPATVLKQWCAEFQKWWPAFRTVILHSIGEGMHSKKRKRKSDESDDFDEEEEADDLQGYDKVKTLGKTIDNKTAQSLIEKIVDDGHIIITTYAGVRIYSQYLLPVKWGYVVLDEGHKIRNPDSYVTITCKQLKTSNRIILSGTPIQNNLVELWSLFDFVFPGKLGTLPVFQRQFCIPINLGGYANATNVQVQAAYKCAVILKELISPYMLRRVKADVARDLPKKSEMVLFCKLTPEQRVLYKKFLDSSDLDNILKGKRNALFGIDTLRKICNHPNLVDFNRKEKKGDEKSAEKLCSKSGKMQVVSALLDLWVSEGRKILLFSQTRQMLDILENLLKAMNNEQQHQYQYLRMDGTTSISKRQTLVDAFNNNPNYTVFLLTTRVGGLGVNLTGASRVIIYDPDWNPSTDMQARERAWRLGQKQDVVIYRLMIAGAIEEKIYHRQIFKQFLTNKILKDPKQKRFFKMTDLYDLFSLGDDDVKGTETGDLFGASETNYDGMKERKTKFKSRMTTDIKKEHLESDLDKTAKLKGVALLENYKGDESQSTMFDDDDSKSTSNSNDNSGVLSKIFQSGSIHSTLSHDSILTSSDTNFASNPSQKIVDNEATRIANDAMMALRQSRKETRKTGVYVPTWTGKHGKAGKVTRTRTVSRTPPPKQAKDNSKNLKATPLAKEDLITQVARYLSGLDDYFSTSGAILDNLNIDVKNENTIKTVRNMLKSICTWNKQKKGWELKEDFR